MLKWMLEWSREPAPSDGESDLRPPLPTADMLSMLAYKGRYEVCCFILNSEFEHAFTEQSVDEKRLDMAQRLDVAF